MRIRRTRAITLVHLLRQSASLSGGGFGGSFAVAFEGPLISNHELRGGQAALWRVPGNHRVNTKGVKSAIFGLTANVRFRPIADISDEPGPRLLRILVFSRSR